MSSQAVNTHRTLASPVWLFGIRIAQVVLSIIVLGMAAAWSDYVLFDAPSLGIAAAVLTWVAVAYILVTEKVGAANIAYSIFAVIALDIFMVILWLATWALNAARRAQLGTIGGIGRGGGGGQFCYNGVCYDYRKRSIERRYTSYNTLSGLLAGVAAIGAFIWVLFIVTLVWTIMSFLAGRKDGRFTFGSSSTTAAADHNMEEQKVQGQTAQPAQQPQQGPQFAQPQYEGQQQPQQQAYPQYPQQPAEAQGQYQAPQVAAGHQQQYPHDPNQVTPQQHQHQQ
ncbi:hypothetical protein ISF_04743 [Cordyceps fumosorosea ARSEF 2679]|uniref:G-protein coupled receptor protein n=1 Tax=Cordyceps fumosorosea (strain ARSEF 2679) TaxID=1081104 RepID=A0A167WP25_CORFA|nr:hypothetical protein ISF_04743 [Cordyceps fumosorosea ARSEF 2679]OAA64034.1 hypothetical protein ISF_04743 [Cordyceps fumosorosea ARSEF 2679]